MCSWCFAPVGSTWPRSAPQERPRSTDIARPWTKRESTQRRWMRPRSASRWPQWEIEDDVTGCSRRTAGSWTSARRRPPTLRSGASGVSSSARVRPSAGSASTPSHVAVETNRGRSGQSRWSCAWPPGCPALLDDLALPWRMALSQEQVSYFATRHLRDFAPDRFPMWIWHGDSFYYGFPVYGEVAVKLARDMRGVFITDETRSYDPGPGGDRVARGIPALPAAGSARAAGAQQDLRLRHARRPGLHPRPRPGARSDRRRIGAGHAAKFAGLIGQIMADLVTSGETRHPIDAFRADRPALTDPSFVPTFRLSDTEYAR